jgi:5-amino-6-(5-phosphoribosylamino)uracil reductase/2,5-diamino-6-(ribosylamino)-4(3H)-pyrimidinone 5'-phosphate reductase
LKAWFHGRRAAADAIMVGANTVRIDDPELTVRYAEGRSPLRVIPSSDGRLPLESRLLNDAFPTLVVVSRRATDEAVAALRAKARVEVMVCGEDRVDLVALMSMLEARGIERMVVEGGSSLLAGLFAADLVSRIIIKHIPVIAGAPDAPTYLGGATLPLSRWSLREWFMEGGVGVSIYEPAEAEA